MQPYQERRGDVPFVAIWLADGNAPSVEFYDDSRDGSAVMLERNAVHEIEFGQLLQIPGFVIKLQPFHNHAVEQAQIFLA